LLPRLFRDATIVSENETPQIGLHLVVERAAESRKLGESLDLVEEISHGPTRSGCVCKEIEDFRYPLEGGFGPDDLVGQLLVSFQKAG
jgi:hypothetical protein